DDRGLARVPVPPGSPHDARPDRAGDRGEDREEQAELDRDGCGVVVPRFAPAGQEADRPDPRRHEGDERDPGHRHVEEEDPAGLPLEAFGERRPVEGRDDHGGHPEPEQGCCELSHGFQTTGKSRNPATTTEPSYRSSWSSRSPPPPPPSAARVAATASTASGTSRGKARAAKRVVAPRPWATIAASTVVAAARPRPPPASAPTSASGSATSRSKRAMARGVATPSRTASSEATQASL